MHQNTTPVRRSRALMGLSLMSADAVIVDSVEQHGGSVLNRVCHLACHESGARCEHGRSNLCVFIS